MSKGIAFADKGAKRGQSILYMEADEFTVIGLDTPHKKGEHVLWQDRALNDPDPAIVAELIRVGGEIYEAVAVRRNGGAAEIVKGRQRIINARAADILREKAGLPKLQVPFVTVKGTDLEMLRSDVISNEHRIEDTVMERARKSAVLLKTESAKIVAAYFRVAVKTIGEWQKLLELHEDIQAAVDAKRIGSSAAAGLAAYSREDQVKELAALLEAGIAPTEAAVKTRARNPSAREEPPYPIPTKAQLRKLAALKDSNLSDDVRKFAAFAIGERNPKTIPGLVDALKTIEKKAKK